MVSSVRKRVVRKREGLYHHGDLKTALKNAALRLIREKGGRGFSLNEASRLAGVSVGAPYRHFKDKDELLAEIACDGTSLLIQKLQHTAAQATGIREKMVAAGMAYLDFAREHAEYFVVLFGAGLDKTKHPEVESKSREAFQIILHLAQQLEKTQENANARAVSCWALVHGLATLSADGLFGAGDDNAASTQRALLEKFLSQRYK